MSAKSMIGRSSALDCLSEGNLLVAIRSYLDGSSNSHLALSALSAPDAIWGEFEIAWKRMLTRRDPQASYLHMTDLVALTDPFSRENGWTDRKAWQLIIDAAKFLSVQDKQRFHAFCCIIDKNARRDLKQKGCDIERPELICAEVTAGAVIWWATLQYPAPNPVGIVGLETLDFFFDRGEKFRHYFEKSCESGKKSNSFVWDLVSTVAPVDMKATPGIQAADLISWSAIRHASKKLRPYYALWEILKEVIPMTICDLNESVLRQKFS